MVNVTASSFEVELTAYSTPRDLSSARFTFIAAADSDLEGNSTLDVALNERFSGWYESAEGRQNGGAFRLRVPFALEGDAGAIDSVVVTLTNSAGTSAAVSGGRQ
jgi:hypothetical protein